jgi:hypothetical protein
MTDSIVPFRPKSDSTVPESLADVLEELEELESILEVMHEHGLESRGDVQKRIDELDAQIERSTDGPRE